eukprot:CAMPEP_0183702674 /NCGR_PEP_ID=MMETSP0737-20130205/700_1 /TAXON_ID=385413 /ORGANISM="Thalassiosira miniscula, Strain CCMP1093" /LENGTH=195 /DNA_ID=CAMNT_0025929325 /DNA_START=98 /DNA_END=685 /DNA_ORIENTATION=+
MPPHVELDCHHDEWCQPSYQLQPLTSHEDEEQSCSPLFRSIQVAPKSSRLDRRQSDPEFDKLQQDILEEEGKEVGSKSEDPAKKKAVVAQAPPAVSVITAIIGPESAYVRTVSPANSATSASTASTTSTSTATAQTKQQRTNNKSPTDNKKAKPIHLRATRYVSKKGWKVVKSLPKKVVSTVRSAKIPGHHRNVV